MKNLFDYIKNYSKKTFLEEKMNVVDTLVLNSIIYIKWDSYIPKKRFKMITLKEAGTLFFDDYKKSKYRHSIIAVDGAIKVLKAVYKTPRYKDIYLYNYVNKQKDLEQFGAVTFKLTDNLIYVAFEGTDKYINSWQENFVMSYKFPILSQKDAIKYLRKTVRRCDKEIVVGGHSKGGNLALVSSMYAKRGIRNRITKIYSADGPGLRMKQFKSKRYERVKSKYIHIIPNYSLVGLILRHDDDYIVVKSSRFSALSHDMITWGIKDKELITTNLTAFSDRFNLYMQEFLDNSTDKLRKKYVDELFFIFKKSGVENIEDIKGDKIKKLRIIIKEIKTLDLETKNMLLEFINFMIKNHSDEIRSKVKKKLKLRT